MPAIRPIHYFKFEKFLKEIGCHLIRPIIVRTKKDLPIMEIKSNLRTLGMSNQEYLNILDQV